MIPGLKANGVNKQLKGTTHSFYYNDFSSLEEIISANNLAVVMEVERSSPPKRIFEKVREICSKKNIVLIFDECTSGFVKHLVDYI